MRNKVWILLLIIITIFACKKDKPHYKPSKNSTVKYAKGFDIIKDENKTRLVIKTPFPEAETAIEYLLIQIERIQIILKLHWNQLSLLVLHIYRCSNY